MPKKKTARGPLGPYELPVNGPDFEKMLQDLKFLLDFYTDMHGKISGAKEEFFVPKARTIQGAISKARKRTIEFVKGAYEIQLEEFEARQKDKERLDEAVAIATEATRGRPGKSATSDKKSRRPT